MPDFPEPPQQRATWESDTNFISPEFESATKTLFEQGLADPRGCDYREIEIRVCEVWRGDGGIVKTHGWVLPNPTASNQVFAVCWNGLVYPVVSAGVKTNLQADMETLIAAAVTNAPQNEDGAVWPGLYRKNVYCPRRPLCRSKPAFCCGWVRMCWHQMFGKRLRCQSGKFAQTATEQRPVSHACRRLGVGAV